MIKYDFDSEIDRRGTDALKVEALPVRWGRTDLTPLWVADMDFRTPPFVMDALRRRCDHEILGYTTKSRSWYTSIIRWLQTRYQWNITPEMLTYTPGIVPGIVFVLQCFTKPGDRVMVQPPVYHPFFLVTENIDREVVYSPLVLENGQYRIDFDRFRRDVKGCKIFILCSPHNPGGRVWSREELVTIATICRESGTIVLSDEIHADLTLPGNTHIPFATVSEAARENSLVMMSPSKAFNMPGLASSYCIIENPELRAQFQKFMGGSDLDGGHVFAFLSVAAAYSDEGTEWLKQAIAYIQGNIDFLDAFLKERIPEIRIIRPEASYLVFLDCRQLELPQEELVKLFVDGAQLALNDGTVFGKEGTGFMRMNVACPRRVLYKALEQLREVVEARF